jgi:hypothetical protein
MRREEERGRRRSGGGEGIAGQRGWKGVLFPTLREGALEMLAGFPGPGALDLEIAYGGNDDRGHNDQGDQHEHAQEQIDRIVSQLHEIEADLLFHKVTATQNLLRERVKA